MDRGRSRRDRARLRGLRLSPRTREPRTARAAAWLLLAASLALAGALLAALEWGLRAAGAGEPDAARGSPLRYQRLELPSLAPALRADGTAVLRPVDPRLGFQELLRAKPERALRVVVFGESAAAGLGFSPNASFASELARLLRGAYPDRAVEVLNLAIAGIASEQVRALVADALRDADPDLLVVSCGHNEFLEVHARRWAERRASPLGRALLALGELRLFRVAHALVRPGRAAAEREARRGSDEALRLPERDLLAGVALAPGEVRAVEERYAANLAAIAAAARAAQVPLVLATAASNARWRGRKDLPADWLAARLGEPGPESPERLRAARAKLDARLAGAAADERWELLYERAVAAERQGDLAAARADYRAARDADPHRRRASEALHARVRGVAASSGAALADVDAALARRAASGLAGFDEFYDYVHPTPRGAVEIAAILLGAALAAGALPPAPALDLPRRRDERLAALAALRADPFDVSEWLGFGFDPGGVSDRDLWKYERLREALDARLAADPGDLAALVYRGNASYFEPAGGPAARRDWEAAARLAPGDPAIRANLARLAAQGR